MGAEWISYVIAIALFAVIVGGILFRMRKAESKETATVLEGFRKEFFPQLTANLNEIQLRLDKREVSEYASLVMRNLSSTLLSEFRLRYESRTKRLEKLREDLGAYEKELAQLILKPKDSVLAARIESQNSGLKRTIGEMIQDVQQLTKIERLPSRLPVIGH